MAEFLKSLGCRMTRTVAAPGDKTTSSGAGESASASAGGGGRTGKGGGDGGSSYASEEAIEAGIVLQDPKASPGNKGRGSRSSSRR